MTDQGPPGGLPIRTEVFFTEDGRARLAKGALQTIGRSRGVWILLALALLYVAFFFFFVGISAGVVILVVVAAAAALITSRIRARTRQSMRAIPAGSVQRAEFGASDFTFWALRPTPNALLGQSFLTTRLMVLRDYADIKNVVVNDHAVGILFSDRPGTREAFPRELFPDQALALISRYTKVSGKWSPPPTPTN